MRLDALSIREIREVLARELAGCAKVVQAGDGGQADAKLEIGTVAVEAVIDELDRRGYRVVRGSVG